MDIKKVARLTACDVLLCYLTQFMADAIAAFRTVFDQMILLYYRFCRYRW